MASIVLLRNPLTPHTREIFPVRPGTQVIDWLCLNHPDGFGMPIRFYFNGEETPLTDLDREIGENDVAAIALMPGDPVTLTTIGIGLLLSAVLSVATYFAMQAFMPKESTQKGSVSIYDIASDQNGARVGDPIPVVYGEVLTTPDYITQPCTWVDWSQASLNKDLYNGVQYLDLLMCVGQGEIDVTDVIVGDTNVKTLDAGVVMWSAFKPAQHQSSMGVIANAMGGGFHENVVTSPEVSNQEFVDTGDSAGFFATCKPGMKGSRFQIDITFISGQTNPNSDGDLRGRTTQFTVLYVELDDNDSMVGSVISVLLTASTLNATTVSGPNITTVTTSFSSDKNRTEIQSPLRRTYTFTTPRSARWAVKIYRNTDAPNAKNGMDRFMWTGLKLFADYSPGKAYGDVTLLACRIKASQGLGQDAAVRVKVRAARLLAPPGGGSEAVTKSAADAFADVYRNAVYGADRPDTELDIATLLALRTKWTGYEFNHVFRERSTIWEALRTITNPFAAEPLPLGAMMSVAQDGIKPVRSMLFTDANIVADSMSINYSFDEEGAADGVEIEHVSPKDWRQSYVTWPSTSLRPSKFTLAGCTSPAHAGEYARLYWQRRLGQRKTVIFDTELEGLVLQMGDRIGIAHNVPKWGDSGLIIGQNGNILRTDHDLDWSGAGLKYVILRRLDGSATDPIPVSRGAQPHKMVLATPQAVLIDGEQEFTSFAFGAADLMVRDFIVTSVRPNGENTVTVEAVNYNPAIYDGAMTYMVA